MNYGKMLPALLLTLVLGCSPAKNDENESTEGGQSQPPPNTNPTDPGPTPVPVEQVQLILLDNYFVRTLTEGVLEHVASLPIGSVITLPKNPTLIQNPYRLPNGQTALSTRGFAPIVRIIQIPPGYELELPPERLRQLMQLPGGLFISGLAIHD